MYQVGEYWYDTLKPDMLPLIKEWFIAHNDNRMEYISNLGLVCYSTTSDGKPGEPIVAYWLYPTPSAVCYSDILLSNPTADARVKLEASHGIIDYASWMAKEMGYKKLITTVENNRMVARLAPHDFHSLQTIPVIKALG